MTALHCTHSKYSFVSYFFNYNFLFLALFSIIYLLYFPLSSFFLPSLPTLSLHCFSFFHLLSPFLIFTLFLTSFLLISPPSPLFTSFPSPRTSLALILAGRIGHLTALRLPIAEAVTVASNITAVCFTRPARPVPGRFAKSIKPA